MQTCSICQNSERNRLCVAREMMFGLRDHFSYLECGSCGCVQLIDVPQNLGRYYPEGYYAYGESGPFKAWVQAQWAAHTFGRFAPVGWLVKEFLWRYDALAAFRRAKVGPSARILDVGCGVGLLIRDLFRLGYSNVTGADPFVPAELIYPGGVRVFKKTLAEIQGQFDFIMLHHSYEHMPEPAMVMQQLARLLATGGSVMIRIPVADSYAWRHFGVNWLHLDPPRHLFLHTRKSIELLAKQAGFKITEWQLEGNETAFLGSEQYQRDIPLLDERSYAAGPAKLIKNWPRVRKFRKLAEEMNRRGEGDWACILLKPFGTAPVWTSDRSAHASQQQER